jgi:hypothetical protein
MYIYIHTYIYTHMILYSDIELCTSLLAIPSLKHGEQTPSAKRCSMAD